MPNADTPGEAMLNAAEALELSAEAMIEAAGKFRRPGVSLISKEIQRSLPIQAAIW